MRAAVVRTFNGPIEIVDVPVPSPGPGQVLVKVVAAAVNPVDLATRAGKLHQAGLMEPQARTGIGWDVAGTIAAPTPGYEVGDDVIGISDRLDLPLGTYAEYVTLDTIVPAPASLIPVEAATLPLNGLTALQALELLALPEGSTLVITGAAGAVGGFALELAVHRGLRVAAVANPTDFPWLKARGAHWLIPRDTNLAAEVRAQIPNGADAAIDAAARGIPTLNAVRNRGQLVSIAPGTAPTPLRGTTVHNLWIAGDPTNWPTCPPWPRKERSPPG
ncbi:NADP-dependent oxidoreductase [Kibdelosporangium lantanae]